MRGFDSCYSCLMIYFSFKSHKRARYANRLTTKTLHPSKQLRKFNPSPKKWNSKHKLQYTPQFNKTKFKPNTGIIFSSLGKDLSSKFIGLYKRIKPQPTRLLTSYNSQVFEVKLVNVLHQAKKIKTTTLCIPKLFNSIVSCLTLNMLLEYYNTSYLTNRKYIQSKKASIIIAQVTESGHFSARSVYLSTTQNTFLKKKLKVTEYFERHIKANIMFRYVSLNAMYPQLHASNFNITAGSQLVRRPNLHVNFINNLFLSTERLIQNLWHAVTSSKQNKRRLTRNIKQNFAMRRRRTRKPSLWIKLRTLIFATRRAVRDNNKLFANFLWQKKKNYWNSKQRVHVRFFTKFIRLPRHIKVQFQQMERQLPVILKKSSAPLTWNPNTLSLNVFKYTSSKHHHVYANISKYSTQVSLLFITNPWLIIPLLESAQIPNLLQTHLSKVNCNFVVHNTNLLPNNVFRRMLSKKILSLFSTNKIREDVIPFYYNTLIRFMEHCSGKKVSIQIYPFLNQNITYDFIVRYKAWITRMKSYERRLGHKFFFEEALHIMHLSFTLRDVVLFSAWLKAIILRISFWKTRTIFRFLRYLFLIYFMHIFPELKIRGLKIRLKGKISAAGNSRKRTILYRVGETSHSKLDLRVSHSKQTINTFTGVMGFQVWLFY
jgi:hypothetical protein